MASKPPSAFWPEPCNCRLQAPCVNLSRLPTDKKRLVWQHIQSQHAEVAELLSSDDFNELKRQLSAQFGPVEVGVNLQDIGGSLYGVRRQAKTRD